MNNTKNEVNVGEVKWVSLDVIELDGSTQGRVADNAEVISEYSAILDTAWDGAGEADGDGEVAVFEMVAWPFPAVVLFLDKRGRHWVGDGFHRIGGAHASEFYGVVADVREGGVKDALKYALGANATHGLRRSSEDLKRCVELASMEYPELSDRQISELVGCAPTTVGRYRPEGARLGSYMTSDGREVARVAAMSGMSGEGESGLSAGMSDEPVTEGADGYVDDGEVREETVAVESGSAKSNGGLGADAIGEYDVAYVGMNDVPSVAEVMPWVLDVPTWGSLLAGCDAPVLRMRDAAGEVQNMIKRDAVLAWCATVVDERLEVREGKNWNLAEDRWWRATDGVPVVRWDGFRAKPVSLEHAERERERWLGEQRKGDLMEWMADLMEGLANGVVPMPSGFVVDRVSALLPRESVELVEGAMKVWGARASGGVDVVAVSRSELVGLLVATPLLARGVDYVEADVLGMGVEEGDEEKV